MIILVLCDTRAGVYFLRFVMILSQGTVPKMEATRIIFLIKIQISNYSLWMVSICNKPVGCGVAIPNASREGALRKAWIEHACLNHFSSLFSTCIVYCNPSKTDYDSIKELLFIIPVFCFWLKRLHIQTSIKLTHLHIQTEVKTRPIL